MYNLSRSQDYFDLELMTKDVRSNWALKLGNLRRLKKSMDRYCLTELQLDTSKYSQLDLPLIARTSSVTETLKLFEYLILLILNCPTKHTFIKRIMDLDEDVQTQMMFFIQKVMANEEEPNQQQEIDKKEIDALRADRKKLADQLSNLEQELTLAHEEYAALHAQLQNFKVENERLASDIGRKSISENRERKAADLEMMVRLAEKDEIIQELKKHNEKNKRIFENELSGLRDELDIANNKLIEAIKNEKLVMQYRKRLESLGNVKLQTDELQRQNENLQSKIMMQNSEIDSLVNVKAQLDSIKDKFEQERVKTETLNFSIESKDRAIKKLEKNLFDSNEKVSFLQKKVEEFESITFFNEHSAMSEDSFHHHHEKENIPLSRDRHKHEQHDLLSKDLQLQKEKTQKQKQVISQLKESLLMQREDLSIVLQDSDFRLKSSHEYIEQLQNNNVYLSEEIHKLSESIKAKETQLMIHQQVLDELDDLKASKLALQNSYKQLMIEKDELVKKLVDLAAEILDLKANLNLKENLIKDLNFNLKDLQEKVVDEGDVDCDKDKVAAQRISELQQRIKELASENNKIIEDSREQIRLAKEEYEKELKKKDEEMIRLMEEATCELMKHREQLVQQLQSEKRNSIMNFQRAMSTRENPFVSNNKELFKLREVLMEKEKEISKLNKNNKELKKCWKQNAKLLKAVWKELGKETLKIEEAVKDSIIL